MHRSVRLLLAVFLVVGGLVANTSHLLAQGLPTPRVSASLVHPQGNPVMDEVPPVSVSADVWAAAGLRAVLIVGPIDGDTGEWTLREIQNMDLAAAVLAAHGITIQRFYTPNNDWNAIVAAAKGAQFLLYRGHGIAWNDVPDVGGFSLKDRMVSSDELRSLGLAPNAIVMLYACYATGSSSSDTVDIGIDEARRRVLQYSAPFMAQGAAGYYANWFGDAFERFLQYLLAGQTLGEAYESYFDYNAATVSRFDHPAYPGTDVWIDKGDWAGYWLYDYAFVGHADETLADLFLGAEFQMPELNQSVYLPLLTSRAGGR